MPTTDELETRLNALTTTVNTINTNLTALTTRVTTLETDFAVIRKHTVQRANIIALTRTLETEVQAAVQSYTNTAQDLESLSRSIDDIRVLLLNTTDSFISNETPTGDVDSSNRDFVTVNPYKEGSLTVYINNQVMTNAFYTESGPSTGAFKLDVAPQTNDAIRVSYIIAES